MSNYKDLAPGTRLTRRASSAGSRDAPLVGVPADRSRGARLCGEPGRQRTLGRGSMLPRGVLFFNLCLIGSSTRSPTWERSLPCDVHQPRFGRQDRILSAQGAPGGAFPMGAVSRWSRQDGRSPVAYALVGPRRRLSTGRRARGAHCRNSDRRVGRLAREHVSASHSSGIASGLLTQPGNQSFARAAFRTAARRSSGRGMSSVPRLR